MQSFKEYLSEHYVTTDKAEEKEKHLDDAHDMLVKSYKKVGGYGGLGHGSKEESDAIKKDIRDPNVIMKLHRKNNKAKSVMLYKKQHGRKMIAAGTSGGDDGVASLHKTVGEDNRQKRAWGEVSHAMEKVYDKHNMPTVSNDKAEKLTGKKILRKSSDSQHYERVIGDTVRQKIIKGHPKLDQ